jgi:hypothetical protein
MCRECEQAWSKYNKAVEEACDKYKKAEKLVRNEFDKVQRLALEYEEIIRANHPKEARSRG